MPQSFVELQQVGSLSRRRHGFDSRTGRQIPKVLAGFPPFPSGVS